MTVETAADRLLMLNDFGESVTFLPKFGEDATVTAIFDNQYNAVDAGGSVDFAMVSPRLTLRTADVPQVVEGDDFLIRNVVYTVTTVMPDGTGITELSLEVE